MRSAPLTHPAQASVGLAMRAFGGRAPSRRGLLGRVFRHGAEVDAASLLRRAAKPDQPDVITALAARQLDGHPAAWLEGCVSQPVRPPVLLACRRGVDILQDPSAA